MKRFLIIATLSLFGIVASFAVSPSSTAILQFPDSTGTNMVFVLNADGTISTDGAVVGAGKSSATALQPNSVGSAATNSASKSVAVTINGTNYLIQLYPN